MDACIAPSTLTWIDEVLQCLDRLGYAVLPGLLESPFIQQSKSALQQAQQAMLAEIGPERLSRANELGVIRIPMKFHEHIFRFMEQPELLAIINATVGETAIMHLQNGFILPSSPMEDFPATFQHSFHQDFPRYMNGYLASINVFFTLDEFTVNNGATWILPASHQRAEQPSDKELRKNAIPVECPAGSMLIFDSTLWHAAGHNCSGKNRMAINHQFTRSFIKQQIDYVRALGEEAVLKQQPRTQQLLGYYTRVVTSLEEYYRPEAERLYRRGQG